MIMSPNLQLLFFFNDTATTEIYTLSLHDALPISLLLRLRGRAELIDEPFSNNGVSPLKAGRRDRKSTRLNSSHLVISYAVFCLKKKKIRKQVIIGGLSYATCMQCVT